MGTLRVTIDLAGNPTIDAQGFTGQGCKAATASLEEKFRGAKLEVAEKPEMYMEAQGEEHLTV